MATHEEQQQARRHLDRAADWHQCAFAGLAVATWLGIGAVFWGEIVWPAASVGAGSLLTWAVGELYIRAARRLLNAQYRR